VAGAAGEPRRVGGAAVSAQEDPQPLRTMKGAWHLCQSLLACRDGATDELIIEVRDALAEQIAIGEKQASMLPADKG
jgi:hypothetical protein